MRQLRHHRPGTDRGSTVGTEAGRCTSPVIGASRDGADWTLSVAIRERSEAVDRPDKVGFALALNKGLGKNARWLWSSALAIPAGSQKVDEAKKFIAWATSAKYINMIADAEGWNSVPAGTRVSLYGNANYVKAAPFAKLAVASIDRADPDKLTVKPVPYVGVTHPSIPEYPSIGTNVGQLFSAALAGTMSIDEALEQAQTATKREMQRAGYYQYGPEHRGGRSLPWMLDGTACRLSKALPATCSMAHPARGKPLLHPPIALTKPTFFLMIHAVSNVQAAERRKA